MKWCDEKIERLRELYLQKQSVKEISKELGFSPASIRNKAYRLGITNINDYTEYEIQYVKENYKSFNLAEISEYLNRPKTNLCRLAKQLGLKRTHKKKQITATKKDEKGVWHKNDWVRETKEHKSKRISESFKKWHSENEHPRGMLGKHHSKEYCQKISERVKRYFENITPEEAEARYEKMLATRIKNDTLNPNKNCSNPYSRTKSGKRIDLNNIFFRSAWEANIARCFNLANIKWEYEPRRFVFENVRRDCISYLPDFYLPETDQWIEVKGWMDEKSKKRLKMFEEYYPDEFKKLYIIGNEEYREIKKFSALIQGWEK